MLLLHFVLKCNHMEWRWLFGPFRYILVKISKLPLDTVNRKCYCGQYISDYTTHNINYSILQTTIYAFSDKFNTKSWLYRYDTMRPLFFKIAHEPFQGVKWFMSGSGFTWFIAYIQLIQTNFCFQSLLMLNVSYDETDIVISGCLVHFRWKVSK